MVEIDFDFQSVFCAKGIVWLVLNPTHKKSHKTFRAVRTFRAWIIQGLNYHENENHFKEKLNANGQVRAACVYSTFPLWGRRIANAQKTPNGEH